MQFFNYKIRRNLLFEYISSLELDLRNYILSNMIDISSFEEKIITRTKSQLYEEKICFMDFGDYVECINSFFKTSGKNEKRYKDFICSIKSVIPIRNRVMHSRPLLADDEKIISEFVDNSCTYESIINFEHLNDSISLVKSNPNYFYEHTPNFNSVYISPSVEHNLPMVDYEDTGFVGREDVKRQIIKKLKSAHPIISIIGDGGIGKTSTVLSCIYDIIDEPDFPFEKVIWVTLKTKSLQNGEFKDIKNSIKSFADSIEKNEILRKEKMTNIELLLSYMEIYKTLFILDNLETINSSEVRDLFEDLPMGSKILITSRIGVGEYETRLVLKNFTECEANNYFRRLVKAYNTSLFEKLSDIEIKNYTEKLYNSPLCIKWFIINVGKGNSPDILINNQDELIEFCLSNVFDKLSDNAKHLLTIILVKQDICSIAEMVYLNNDDYMQSIKAVNELCGCNFLEQVDYGKYCVPEFARKYLIKKIDEKSKEYIEVKKKNNELIGKMENLSFDIHLTGKRFPLSLFPSDESEKIATIYMLKFIEISKKDCSFEVMDELLEPATKAAPAFSDMYKVAAYIYGVNNVNNKAREYYELALEYAKTSEDKAYIKSFYSGYLANVGDYQTALEMIDSALQIIPNEPYFVAKKIRVVKCQKQYDTAIDMINGLLKNCTEIDDSLKRVLYKEYLDILARKIDVNRDDDERKKAVKDALELLSNIDIAYYSFDLYKAMSKLLNNMLLISGRISVKLSLRKIVDNYLIYILSIGSIDDNNKLFDKINLALGTNYSFEDYVGEFKRYEYGYISRLETNGFGFISIKRTRLSLFFHASKTNSDFSSLNCGDYVQFIPSLNKKRWQAILVEKVNDYDEDCEDEEKA